MSEREGERDTVSSLILLLEEGRTHQFGRCGVEV
jgi:hypothetical protein